MTTTNISTSLESRIPQAIGFVLDRNEIGVSQIKATDNGAVEIALSAYTPNGMEVSHRLALNDIEDIEGWTVAFSRMVDVWDPADALVVDAESFMAMPFAELIARYGDLTAYEKQTLEATRSDLSLLNSRAFLEMLAA